MSETNPRDGTECKKTDCVHYPHRKTLASIHMSYCRECKWAYRSQWKKMQGDGENP